MEITKPKEIKASIFIAMPCYDSVKINTMLSIFQTIQLLGKGGIEIGINTMKSPLIHQSRNYLTSVFLTTDYTHLLFIDSDVEFAPEAILRMLMADKDIICTPYRAKNPNLTDHTYTVQFPDPKVIPVLPGGLVEIEAGPTGLMLIHRRVFEKIIKNRPDLKIKNRVNPGIKEDAKSHSFYHLFFDFAFDDGYTMGEDLSFCKLARKQGFKIYANTESPTAHRGEYAWVGKFGDSLKDIK
tara:strand:- start:20 stop:739 length:720 start_codon:yes stop_codon:yes gene_type:complete